MAEGKNPEVGTGLKRANPVSVPQEHGQLEHVNVEPPPSKTETELLKELPPVGGEDETEKSCLCMTITVMVLSIFGLNLFSFLFSLFLMIYVNGERDTRKRWERVVYVFYVIAFVVIIVAIVVFIILLIVFCVKVRAFMIAFSIYIIIMCALTLAFSIIARSRMMKMADDARAMRDIEGHTHQYLGNPSQ